MPLPVMSLLDLSVNWQMPSWLNRELMVRVSVTRGEAPLWWKWLALWATYVHLNGDDGTCLVFVLVLCSEKLNKYRSQSFTFMVNHISFDSRRGILGRTGTIQIQNKIHISLYDILRNGARELGHCTRVVVQYDMWVLLLRYHNHISNKSATLPWPWFLRN